MVDVVGCCTGITRENGEAEIEWKLGKEGNQRIDVGVEVKWACGVGGIDAWAENLIWKMSVEALERFLRFSLALSIYIAELSSHALYIIITTRICCFAGRKYEKSQCAGDAYRLSFSLSVFLSKVYTCYIIIPPDIYSSKIQNSQCADNVYWLDFYLKSRLHIT